MHSPSLADYYYSIGLVDHNQIRQTGDEPLLLQKKPKVYKYWRTNNHWFIISVMLTL